MIDLLGLFSITLVSLITFIVSMKLPSISRILFVALTLRILLLFIGEYINLPDSGRDEENFEWIAWQYAKDGFFNLLSKYTGPDPHFYSWFIAIPYSLFDRSELMSKSISLLFGMGSILLGWLIAKKIWNKTIANKVAWMIALFPTLILYSILMLREIYVVFFLLLALYGVFSWTRTGSLKSIILALSGFLGATFFHGATFVGGLVFLGFVILKSLKETMKSLFKFKINLKIFILIFMIIGSGFYIANNVYIPYLETFSYSTNLDTLFQKTEINTRGDASFPEWTIISTPSEMFYKLPVRGIYFIFSPFPWQISDLKHLVGLLDAFLFMYLSFLIFQNRKDIWKDPALRIFLVILLVYIIVFAIGVGNFGTGIRHRAKFVIIFIFLAAPLLKTFIFKKKNKI